jgi:HEAT repeat protein
MIRLTLGAVLGIAAAVGAAPAPVHADALSDRAVAVLQRVFAEDHTWVKVHAAEVLARFGHAPEVRTAFLAEAPAAALSPYRVGIWRVLAETAPSPSERDRWIAPIMREALDAAPDPKGDPGRRLRAIESLGKLRVRLSGRPLAVMREFACTAAPAEAPLPLWSLALAGEPGALDRLSSLLSCPSDLARMRAAYALRWLRPSDPGVLRRLVAAAGAEPGSGAARPFLLSAALTLDADPRRSASWRSELANLPPGGSTDARFEAAQALMSPGDQDNLARATLLLDDPDANTQVGAAWTILEYLRSGARSPRRVTTGQ